MATIHDLIKSLESLRDAKVLKEIDGKKILESKDMIELKRTLRDLINAQIVEMSSIEKSNFPFYSQLDFNLNEINIDWNGFLSFLDSKLPFICQNMVENAQAFKKNKKYRTNEVIFVERLIDSFEVKESKKYWVYFYARLKRLWDEAFYRVEKLQGVELLGELEIIKEDRYLDAKEVYLRSLYDGDDIVNKYVMINRSYPTSFMLDVYDMKIASDLRIDENRLRIIQFLKKLEFMGINDVGEISFSILKKKTETDIIKDYVSKIIEAKEIGEVQAIQNQFEILISFMGLTPPSINKINGIVTRRIENIIA